MIHGECHITSFTVSVPVPFSLAKHHLIYSWFRSFEGSCTFPKDFEL